MFSSGASRTCNPRTPAEIAVTGQRLDLSQRHRVDPVVAGNRPGQAPEEELKVAHGRPLGVCSDDRPHDTAIDPKGRSVGGRGKRAAHVDDHVRHLLHRGEPLEQRGWPGGLEELGFDY
jgi:hypothetical protein